MSSSQEEQAMDEQTLDLTIEALTGTVYDLCVSPYETILGIKTKIQNLEGIPVYQQQLVYGNNELQDDYCLAEYAIPSGAQLKLLIAMRGGPIHAQRVHLELEDPTLIEIAEFLDSQAGDKYTVMLVRNSDELDTANLVRVQMTEDSCESLSCSPVHMTSEPHHDHQASQPEHAVMRDKVKDVMAKLKKNRSYKQSTPLQPSKVLILESRASSRLLANSSRGSPLQSRYNEPSRLSTAQRRLMFTKEDRSCGRCVGGANRGQRSMVGVSCKRSHTPHEETPQVTKKEYSRLTHGDETRVSHDDSSGLATRVRQSHDSRKSSKRVRRSSQLDQEKRRSDPLSELSQQMSGLELGSHNGQSFLPSLSTAPVSLTTQTPPTIDTPTNKGRGRQKNRCMQCSKRVGLASSYNCRCGGMYCATHRYAESHSCSYDYKEEGRRMLSRNNPVVTAPKLPKI